MAVRLTAILAASAAGLLTWLAAERGTFHVEPAAEKTSFMGQETTGPTARTKLAAAQLEVSAAYGTLGLLLGAGLGLSGAVGSRSWRRALAAGSLGGALGALAGFLMPWVVLAWYNRGEEQSAGDLGRSLVMHLGLWVLIGAAAGLGFGVGRSGPRHWGVTLVGGAVGAAVGTLCYDIVGAFVFPLAETGKPISEAWETRLMAFLFVAMTTAVATLAVADAPATKGPTTSAPLT